MSSCDDGVCGTGGFTGPKPGDPNSVAGFNATPGYGGINLNWSLPTLNPFAVSHVRIFRGTSSSPLAAVLLVTIHGDFHFDKVLPGTTYYYWLEVVSVNGTYAPWIGPASSYAMDNIAKTIADLSGKIDNGVLATALRDKIGEITLLGNSITQEVNDRLAALNALSATVGGLQGQLTTAITILESETQQRIDADGALVTQLDIWAAGFENSIAGIVEEIIIEVGPDGGLANKVTTLETSVFGDTATLEEGLVTKVTVIDGKVTDIGALYTVKTNVNGLVGGFGIYNDGTEIEAGFDVDRFWIGKSGLVAANWTVGANYTADQIVSYLGYNWKAKVTHVASLGNAPPNPGTENAQWLKQGSKIKPFIVEGDVVYINEAAINKLTFSKLRNEDGSLTVDETGKLKAAYVDTKGLVIRDLAGNVILGAGAGATLSWNFLKDQPAGIYNSNIVLNSDGTLTGAGGGQVTTTGLGIDEYRVLSKGGHSTSHPAVTMGLYKNGVLLGGVGRSYTVFVINRATGALVSTTTYDVWVNAVNADEMATALNALDNTKLVVIVGDDEPMANRLTNGLPAAMYRCGASRNVFGSTAHFKRRGAYILYGIPGLGEGNGTENYQGSVDDDVNAWCEATFSLKGGNFIGTSPSITPKQNPAKFGTDITLSNGTVISDTDFVHSLSKITAPGGSNPLSLFMEAAAIGNAYIGNAAIQNANIGDLQVSTIKIGNDQVSVPKVVSASNTVTANNSWQTILTTTVNLTSPGAIFAHASIGVGLGGGSVYMSFDLYVNDVAVATIAGNAETYGISIGGGVQNLAAGEHTVAVVWYSNTGASVYTRSLLVQGVMK